MYWNEYKSKIETITQAHNDNNYIKSLLDAKIPGVNSFFVIGFNDNVVNPNANPIVDEPQRVKRDSHRKYFLPRIDIKDYNILIDSSGVEYIPKEIMNKIGNKNIKAIYLEFKIIVQ